MLGVRKIHDAGMFFVTAHCAGHPVVATLFEVDRTGLEGDDMGAQDNKELVRHIYTEISNGNPKPLYDHLPPDITWTIIGSTQLSGTFRGIDEVTGKLFAGLRAALTGPVRFTFDRFIAEDDHVVFEARGKASTPDGRPYENRYCIVVHIVDGWLREITDYVDTELVTNTLFRPAA
jgi:uncharacterized protein